MDRRKFFKTCAASVATFVSLSTSPLFPSISSTMKKWRTSEEYEVVFHDDDLTEMNFVVNTLEKSFQKNHEEAIRLMVEIHYEGSGTCGPYSKEEAIKLSKIVMSSAREAGFPLTCSFRLLSA